MSNQENARKRYAAAAATGTAYHAPQESQTPAPLYFQSGYQQNPIPAPSYRQTPSNPAHQAAMNKLFTRPNGTRVPGPYPHGYYPPAVAASRGYNQAVLGTAAAIGTAGVAGVGAAGVGAVDAAIKLGEVGCAGCNAGCACVLGGRRSRKRKTRRKNLRKKTHRRSR